MFVRYYGWFVRYYGWIGLDPAGSVGPASDRNPWQPGKLFGRNDQEQKAGRLA